MLERYIMPFNEGGLTTLFFLTKGLRRAGFKTRVVEDSICGFPVYVLLAVPRPRPSRKERGL